MDRVIIFIQMGTLALLPRREKSLITMKGHYYMTEQFTDDFWLRYMVWILYLLFFAGVSMLSTRIAPTAQGSGIPEMKAILSGKLHSPQ